MGCEKRFEVDIDGNVRTKTINLECSTLTIEAYCVSRVFFYITISNEPKGEQPCTVLFYPDLLNIIFKNTKIPYESIADKNDRTKSILDNPIDFGKHKAFVISFHINDPLPQKGDTIMLEDMGYLYSQGKRIEIGDIIITIK